MAMTTKHEHSKRNQEHTGAWAHHRTPYEPRTRTTKAVCTNTMNIEPRERQAHGLVTANVGTDTMTIEPHERRAHRLATTNVGTNTMNREHSNGEHTGSQRRTTKHTSRDWEKEYVWERERWSALKKPPK